MPNKFLTWFQRSFWPWSRIGILESHLADQIHAREAEQQKLAFLQAEFADYKKQATWWYEAVRGELTREQLASVQAKIDREAEAECTRIGNVAHAADRFAPAFPPKGSGLIDPKLESKDVFSPFVSPAANAVRKIAGDPTVPKLDDLKRDLAEHEKAHGGPILWGQAFPLYPPKKEEK